MNIENIRRDLESAMHTMLGSAAIDGSACTINPEYLAANSKFQTALAALTAYESQPAIDERAEFEAWAPEGLRGVASQFAIDNPTILLQDTNLPDREYHIDDVESARRAWQARAALAPAVSTDEPFAFAQIELHDGKPCVVFEVGPDELASVYPVGTKFYADRAPATVKDCLVVGAPDLARVVRAFLAAYNTEKTPAHQPYNVAAQMAVDVLQAYETQSPPSGDAPKVVAKTIPEFDRETLGMIVRASWLRWSRAQKNPKPSWLLLWEELAESDKEVDRQIGERLANFAACATAEEILGKPRYYDIRPLGAAQGAREYGPWEETHGDAYRFVLETGQSPAGHRAIVRGVYAAPPADAPIDVVPASANCPGCGMLVLGPDAPIRMALQLPADGAYIIRYDDSAMPDEFFALAGARDAALDRYRRIGWQWNAHLYVKIDTNNLAGKDDCPNATFVATADPRDAEDARRYRHIRNRDNSLERVQQDTGVDYGVSCYHIVDGIRELKFGDDLDTAIDRAMGAKDGQS